MKPVTGYLCWKFFRGSRVEALRHPEPERKACRVDSRHRRMVRLSDAWCCLGMIFSIFPNDLELGECDGIVILIFLKVFIVVCGSRNQQIQGCH